MAPEFSESSLRIRAALSGATRRCVLVGGDDHALRHLLVCVLKRMDLDVVECGLDRESREQVMLLPGRRKARRIDVAILDARREPTAALAAISPVLAAGDAGVLVITGDDDIARDALVLGAGVLRPPITATGLRAALESMG